MLFVEHLILARHSVESDPFLLKHVVELNFDGVLKFYLCES